MVTRPRLSKRNRSIALGLLCGLGCALCVGMYIAQLDEQARVAQAEALARYGGDQIEVCVAKRDIAAGDVIAEGDVEIRTWIATLLPAQAVTDKKDAVGKQAGSMILAGEVISSARFGFESANIDVPEGLVAISVPARDVQAVGGALEAGMVTDVFSVGSSGTTKLASSVQVLATSLGSGGASGGAWVTVAVRPSLVEGLVSAAENTELYFSLPSSSALSASAPSSSAQRTEEDGEEDQENAGDAL